MRRKWFLGTFEKVWRRLRWWPFLGRYCLIEPQQRITLGRNGFWVRMLHQIVFFVEVLKSRQPIFFSILRWFLEFGLR